VLARRDTVRYWVKHRSPIVIEALAEFDRRIAALEMLELADAN
jgi:hypothetical protein